MSIRGSLLIVCLFYFLNCFHFGHFQGQRPFDDVCENCTVVGGSGYACHPNQCNCYITCVLRTQPFQKLALLENPWLSFVRCCPSHTTFSLKRLTCVDYTNTLSDCFDRTLLHNNPCSQKPAGRLIPSYISSSAGISADKPICNGFLKCEKVGGTVVPNPSCCEKGKCFSEDKQACASSFCTGSCAALNESDCDRPTMPDTTPDTASETASDKTPEPLFECPYVGVNGSITKFMYPEHQGKYECAPGTMWDQGKCACLENINTTKSKVIDDDCLPHAELDFDDNDKNTRDGRGNTIWTEVYGNATIDNDMANFVGDGYISMGGLAETFLSNQFILHFEFSIADKEEGETECLVGSCLEKCTNNSGVDTIAITLDSEMEGEDIVEIWLTYEDGSLLLPGVDATETARLEITTDIKPEYEHELWLFYGWENQVHAGIFREENLVGAMIEKLDGSVQLVPPPSGFVFGRCLQGNDFMGTMDEIEMWTSCKPQKDARLEKAYDQIKGYFG